MSNTITSIKWRAQNSNTIHDMAMGLSPAPKINPTINQAEIDDAENKLGIKFPQLLKDILIQIGNGGFGPGYGLYELSSMVETYQNYMNDGYKNWQKGLLPLLTWGCTYESCVDCLTENNPVYFTEIVDDDSCHCLDYVSFTVTDKEGNLISSGNTGNGQNQQSNSPIQIETKTQAQSFEKFMNDWANGVNLWDEIMGENNDNAWNS
jgi:hypothetical protein